MTTHKEKAIADVEKMLQASEESLAKYNEGYREGYSDGYDDALEKAREVAEKYSLGVTEKELKPATRFMGNSLECQISKIHDEYIEVLNAVMRNESKERIAEELADVQQACETAMAILGMTEDERKEVRHKVVIKNGLRGYYMPERSKYGD